MAQLKLTDEFRPAADTDAGRVLHYIESQYELVQEPRPQEDYPGEYVPAIFRGPHPSRQDDWVDIMVAYMKTALARGPFISYIEANNSEGHVMLGNVIHPEIPGEIRFDRRGKWRGSSTFRDGRYRETAEDEFRAGLARLPVPIPKTPG